MKTIPTVDENMMDFLSDLTTDIDLLAGDAKDVTYWFRDYQSRDRANIKEVLLERIENNKEKIHTPHLSHEEEEYLHNRTLDDIKSIIEAVL